MTRVMQNSALQVDAHLTTQVSLLSSTTVWSKSSTINTFFIIHLETKALV